MKNKFVCDFIENQHYVELEERSDASARRHSSTPRIIVCPPTDDQLSPARRIFKVISQRMGRNSSDDSGSGSDSSDRGSSSSESGSETSDRQRKRSPSVSIRKVFQSLSISPRSHSAEREKKNKEQPRRILRQPVVYTYQRGMSGLPTQRIPRAVTVSGLSR